MPVKVCKFGGTSVADAGQLRRVQQIVEGDSERRCIVPSAPGRRFEGDVKVTDQLYRSCALAARGGDFGETFGWVEDRYRSILTALAVDLDLSLEFKEIRERIAAGATTDYVASRGEYLSGLVVAALLDFEFVDAAEIIRFDDEGRFEPDATQAVVTARLTDLGCVVVPGFYGARPDGEIVTFSRGGSDVTGAILARGAGASVYENWTDVSGMLMADPRIVDAPRTIEVMTYRELRELAYMGATVLHDEAIFPVREAGIPVHIRNTNDPDANGTLIVRGNGEPSGSSPEITGIAGRKDFTILAVEKTLMNAEVGFARRMLGVLEARGISFEHMPSGIDTMSLIVKDANLGDQLDGVVDEIRRVCEVDSIEVLRDISLIATVGRGMLHTPGMAARLFSALAEAGVNVRMIDQGSSELNIIVGVAADDFERAVEAIYRAFVPSSPRQ